MTVLDPTTPEAKLWLSEFNREFMAWIGSGQQDDVRLVAMGGALTKLFDRSPDYAATIQTVAIGASFLAHRRGPKAAAQELASTGLLAAAVSDGEPAAVARLAALQSYYLADIHLAEGRRFDGLAALSRVRRELDRVDGRDPVGRYIRALSARLEGELHELGLEHQRAGDAFDEAVKEATGIMRNFDAIGRAVLEAVLGDNPATAAAFDQLLPLVGNDVSDTLMRARFGLARTLLSESQESGVTGDERTAAVNSAWIAQAVHRLPSQTSVTDVFQVVAALPPKEARKRVKTLLASAETDVVTPLADWHALLEATLGRCYAADGNTKAANEAGRRAARLAAAATPIVAALVHGTNLMAGVIASRDGARTLSEKFSAAMRRLRSVGGNDLRELRLRALLDEPVAVAIRFAFEDFETQLPGSRVKLGRLLDALRRSGWMPLGVDVAENDESAFHFAQQAYDMASDHLLRIAHGVQVRPETLGLIVQACQEETLFLCVTADREQPVAGYFADDTYREASRALAKAAAAGLSLVRDSTVATAGRAVFEALPQPVQQLLTTHRTVLLSPDLRSDEDSIPFELIHDGKTFLGVSKAIARVASLRDMAHALETVAAGPRKRRALVACAPDAEGYPTLTFANEERVRVADTLSTRGWDAPAIEPTRLTAGFFLDRLRYIGLLHVAAHGHATAGSEALILPRGARLTADDLVSKRFPTMPFVYLNTCLLAQTRYLGGGVSRGIAHTLFELGAPAVVANMTPVYEKIAVDVSAAFYRHAESHSVGEALRLARGDMHQAGVPPSLWGTTVLVGDPRHRLEAPEPSEARDPVIDLLDAYLNGGSTSDRTAAYQRTLVEFSTNVGNARAGAALAFVQAASRLAAIDTEEDEAAVDLLIEVANELRHLPSEAMTRTLKATHLADSGADNDATATEIDRALVVLDALQGAGDLWDRIRLQLLARRKSIGLAAVGLQRRYSGDFSAADKGAADALLDVIEGVQQAQESERGVVGIRAHVETVEDVAHNAIVIGWSNRFEDMREIAAYATTLVNDLVRLGFLPSVARPHAERILAGLLSDLWGRQPSAGLQAELVEGWAGALVQAVADVARTWTAPEQTPWFAELEDFEHRLDAALERIEAASYDEVYECLEKEFSALSATMANVLGEIERHHPATLGAAYGWLTGTIIRRNTYSPLDGSVPEDIDERLKKLATVSRLLSERYLFRYLADGFSSVRNKQIDELERWRLDVKSN